MYSMVKYTEILWKISMLYEEELMHLLKLYLILTMGTGKLVLNQALRL